MRSHGPILLALLLGLAAGPATAALQAGDLVATDRAGRRLWQIRPDAGTAEVFSPPAGFSNLFDSPTDVVTTSDRAVYVTDGGWIVSIDPDSGEQFPLLTLALSPAPHLVPMVFEGTLAGIDADANGALWVVETRAGLPGRLWKVAPVSLGWARTLVHTSTDLARIGNGLAVTSDDAGDANDVFFPTRHAGMVNVDVGSGAANELEPDVPPGVSESFAGGIDAIGDCEELLCTVLFTRATWPATTNSCTASQVYTYFIVAIIGGVEPIDFVLPCATGIVINGASDAYVLMVDFREIGGGTPTRVIRFRSLEGDWVSEHVAWLGDYETVTRDDAVAGMDIVLAPEPGAVAAAGAALAALARRRRT